jgi:D-glucosaminate-specific PTS system IIB component
VSISHVRVDDRLIHGQVVATWVSFTGTNAVYVVDDRTAKDSFQVQLMNAVAPRGLEVRVVDLATAKAEFSDWVTSPKHIMILARIPQTLLAMVESGASIKSINIGGMGFASGKRSLYQNISASEEERNTLRRLSELGVEVYFQMLSTQRRKDMTVDMLK